MLAAFRAFAKSWVAAVLMGVLILAFAVWGIRRDVFTGHVSDAVVSAGSRTVSAAEFRREFERFKGQFEQQAGQPIPNELAVQNGLDKQVLEGLATREAFAELMSKMGIHPSDKLVAQQIEKIPAFFDQVSGRFDKRAYQQRLADNGLTPAAFEREMRDELSEQQLGAGIVAGLEVPRAYSAMAAVFELEGRDVAAFSVGPQNVAKPADPTDAQLTTFMKENAAQLTRPEFRQLTLVVFDPQQLGANLPVDPAELKKRYDFKKDTLSKPETRTIVQIPAKDPAAATQIAARLSKGEDPAAVAKAFGVEPVTYADKPQSAIADKTMAAAAFQMKAGQVAPVKGELGLSVVKVAGVTPGHQVTLEEIKPALEAEIRKDAAASKVDALTQAYDDAHQKGASLPEAAKKAGVPTVTLGPVAKQGVDQQGKPVAGLNPKVLDTAFSLPAGGESELTEAGGGAYFAVRVDKVIPPALPSLDEVRPQLTKAWLARQLGQEMSAKADELAARARKGESLDALAASVGAKVGHLSGLTRANAGQMQGVSPDLVGQAFTGKVGDVFTARGAQFNYLVAKLEAVHTPQGPEIPRMAEAARQQMTVAYIREVEMSARQAARAKIKVTLDPDRARAALGVEAPTPAAGGKPGPAK